MFRIVLLLLALAFSAVPAAAQTCPTRPTGDSTNACASTAFTNNQINSSISTMLTFPITVGNGTSGAIPCFASTTVLTKSAVLAANAIMVGGGAGICPSTTTTGTGVISALGNATGASGGMLIRPGTWVNNNVPKISTASGIVDSGIAAAAFTGDSGSGGSIGFVPAPGAGDSAAGKFLAASGSWQLPSALSEPVNAQTGTTYTFVAGDKGKLVNFSNTSSIAVTLPQATGSFSSGFFFDVQNINTGLVTITPTTSTIDGASTLIVPKGYGLRIVSDGANWQIFGFKPLQGRVLLNTLTASSSATLDDTTSITSAFSEYEVEFVNITPATNAVTCQIQIRSGGTFQTASYASVGMYGNALGAGTTGSISTYIPCSYTATLPNTAPGISGKIRVTNPLNTTVPKIWYGQFFGSSTSYPPLMLSSGGYWSGSNAAVDGVRVLFSSGNIASGTIKIYGSN